MPYFAIKAKGEEVDVCVCQAKKIEDVDYNDFLGTRKKWEIREIDALEAEALLHELNPRDSNLENLVRCVAMPLSYTHY